jgi:hypothetical protein
MSSISEITRQVQEAGLYDKHQCPHCGLPADRDQNGIQGYRCGSSYCETFKPQWARSMTCLELQNGQLQERIKRLEDRIQKLESLASLGGPSVKFCPLDPPFGTAADGAKP